jgi:hypothetical protein
MAFGWVFGRGGWKKSVAPTALWFGPRESQPCGLGYCDAALPLSFAKI